MYIIDRIDGNLAICECINTGEMIKFNIQKLPKKAKEGDVLRKEGNTFIIDYETTKQRKKALTERMNRLFRK